MEAELFFFSFFFCIGLPQKQFYKQNGSRFTVDRVYICFIPLDMFELVLRPTKRPTEQAVFISFVLCVIESSKSESLSAKQTH